ncbi:MAG: hypothetical protein ACJ8AH_02830 [Stellaceae bacterium]|jgi:hypothetical protein
MVRKTKSLLLAIVLPAAAFSAALAFADDHGRMTGSEMMDRGMMGDTRGGMMGHGIGGCMQMMQGMHGGNHRPNEQWRQRQP